MALLSTLLSRNFQGEFSRVMRDSAMLMLGFALFWAGQLYAQYLTIWYGNIPEEVAYLSRRVLFSPYMELSIFVVIAMFLVPFTGMIPRKTKLMPVFGQFAAILIMVGYIVEKWIYIDPVIHLDFIPAVLQAIVLGIPFMFLLFRLAKLREIS